MCVQLRHAKFQRFQHGVGSGRVAGQIDDNFGGTGRTLVGRVGSGSKKVTRVHLWRLPQTS